MPSAITIDDSDVLLAIDLQADFMPGGALAVDEGDPVVPLVNALMNRFAHVVVTQDWHPPGHASFASTHGAEPFATKRPITANRHCGPITASEAPRARRSMPHLPPTKPFSFYARACTRASIPIPLSSRRTARRPPGLQRSSTRAASSACSPAVLRPTIASPFPRSTRARPNSNPS